MFIPTSMRHDRNEDNMKQPRQCHDDENDEDEEDDDHHQKHQHRPRCFGRSNSLFLRLSLLVTVVVVFVVGSGFCFANILRSGENMHPIIIVSTKTITNTNTNNSNSNSDSDSDSNSNSNNNNNREMFSITATTEKFVLSCKDSVRELLQKYGSVREYKYDDVYADGNYRNENSDKDEELERELKLAAKGKAKESPQHTGKDSRSSKSSKKTSDGGENSKGSKTRSPVVSPIYLPTGNPTTIYQVNLAEEEAESKTTDVEVNGSTSKSYLEPSFNDFKNKDDSKSVSRNVVVTNRRVQQNLGKGKGSQGKGKGSKNKSKKSTEKMKKSTKTRAPNKSFTNFPSESPDLMTTSPTENPISDIDESPAPKATPRTKRGKGSKKKSKKSSEKKEEVNKNSRT
jgi:hypothetical protein